jgi:hypothetical protein
LKRGWEALRAARQDVLRLEEGRGWKALGYATWAEFPKMVIAAKFRLLTCWRSPINRSAVRHDQPIKAASGGSKELIPPLRQRHTPLTVEFHTTPDHALWLAGAAGSGESWPSASEA